jgi:hypothetical protein
MLLSRYRVPKIARPAALNHMNDYDLENQSCGTGRASRRRSTTVLTATGINELSLLKARSNVRSVAATIWPWSFLSDLMRSAHCRSMRRWTLRGYMALITFNLADALLRYFVARLMHHLSTGFVFTSPAGSTEPLTSQPSIVCFWLFLVLAQGAKRQQNLSLAGFASRATGRKHWSQKVLRRLV